MYSCKSPIQYNHDVVAVGYGEEGGQKYVLLRNSWGRSWGLDGYFKVAASSSVMSNCGIGWNPSFPLSSYSLNAKPNVLMNWTCDISHYGTGDGCHCNCGAYDPDCYDCAADVFGCGEFERAKCSDTGACIDISSWNCSACWYGDGEYCDCDCGAQVDPDCLAPQNRPGHSEAHAERFNCNVRPSCKKQKQRACLSRFVSFFIFHPFFFFSDSSTTEIGILALLLVLVAVYLVL